MIEYYEYPTEEELKKVHDFKLSHNNLNLPEFIQFLQSIWWAADWGFKYNQEKGCLELHTGGWSGNESIIEALHGTWFWYWFWAKSIRGGHYWFELYMFDEEGKQKKNPEIRLQE
jgi:hypothetical protein